MPWRRMSRRGAYRRRRPYRRRRMMRRPYRKMFRKRRFQRRKPLHGREITRISRPLLKANNSRLICMTARVNYRLNTDPELVEGIYTEIHMTTAVVSDKEWTRVMKIAQQFNKFRFIGMTFSVMNLGSTLVSYTRHDGVITTQDHEKSYARLSVVDGRYTTEDDLKTNIATMDEAVGITRIRKKGRFNVIFKYRVPYQYVGGVFVNTPGFFSAVPATGHNIPDLVGYNMTSLWQQGPVGVANAAPYVMFVAADHIPKAPGVPGSASDQRVSWQHSTSFQTKLQFYFQFFGPKSS